MCMGRRSLHRYHYPVCRRPVCFGGKRALPVFNSVTAPTLPGTPDYYPLIPAIFKPFSIIKISANPLQNNATLIWTQKFYFAGMYVSLGRGPQRIKHRHNFDPLSAIRWLYQKTGSAQHKIGVDFEAPFS